MCVLLQLQDKTHSGQNSLLIVVVIKYLQLYKLMLNI